MKFGSRSKALLLMIVLLFSMSAFLRFANAQLQGLQVYIIDLSGIPTDSTEWVTNQQDIVYGALNACAVTGLEMNYNVPWFHSDQASYPQYYDVQPMVITSWDIYTQVITGAALNDREGLIFLNTHGEFFPVPANYNEESWMSIIANLMLHYRATWINTNGYPFYWVYYENGTQKQWGVGGFNYFLSFINLQGLQCWPPGWPPSVNENVAADIDGGFKQNVADGTWPSISQADSAELGRPLNESDFCQNLQLIGFSATEQGWGCTYLPVAMFTYAAPGNYTNTHGFGSFVQIGTKYFSHLGAGCASSDWERGYVGMVLALTGAASGFPGSVSTEGSWQSCYNRSGGNNTANFEAAVCPFIDGFYSPGEDTYYNIFVIFPITVALNESYFPDGGGGTDLYGSQIDFSLDVNSSLFSNATVMLDPTNSFFGNASASGSTFSILGLNQAQLQSVANLAQFGLSFVDDLGDFFSVSDALQLWSQWATIPGTNNGTGVGQYANSIVFDWDVTDGAILQQMVRNNDGQTFNMTEQESMAFYVDLKVPTPSGSWPNGWYQIPLQYNVTVWPTLGLGYFISAATIMNTANLDAYIGTAAGGGGQCDAGVSGDAGNDPVHARPLNYSSTLAISYYGFLCNFDSNEQDLCDWYDFNISSGTYITIILLPPVLACYNLSLYSSSNWYTPVAECNTPEDGQQQSIVYQAGAGTWYIDVGWVDGSGIYDLELGGPGGGGGGCPFICPWNGTSYAVDNNILPLAEHSNGSDVQDYYMLQQPLVPSKSGLSFSTYSLQISEFENEHDYLNQIGLYAVDHPQNVNVGVSPSGQILTYQNPQPPLLAQDQNGRDWTKTISGTGNSYYQSEAGDYMNLYFPQVSTSNAKLVIREDPPDGRPIKESIYVQLMMTNGSWLQVADIPGRTNMSTDVIDFSSYLKEAWNPIEVRLYFTSVHRVDFVGLDTTPQASIQIKKATLVSAVNSANQSVLPQLLFNDSQYAQLTPGQQITITFLLPPLRPNELRNFVFYIDGHYYTIQSASNTLQPSMIDKQVKLGSNDES
jgi:hypothetical protein